MIESPQEWQAKHRQLIQEKLAGLREKPDGTIRLEPSGIHWVMVEKIASTLQLMLVEKVTMKTKFLQSWVDLNDPFKLVLPYTQAMALGLIWHPTPRRIYLAGLGGGSLHRFLYYNFPEVYLESTEIDPLLIQIATECFGLEINERLQVFLQDGRDYLEKQPPSVKYDLIFIDVAYGNGYIPYSFTTQEFYKICQNHLSESGVLVINSLQELQWELSTIKTLQSVFQSVYIYSRLGNNVLIANPLEPLDEETIITQAQILRKQHKFSNAILSRVLDLQSIESYLKTDLSQEAILTDATPPSDYFASWLL